MQKDSAIHGIENFGKRAENYKVVTSDIVRTVDVCVIGSGAAGAVLAAKLAKAGKSVVMLERGGYYDGESMNQREADMIPLLWKNAGANFTSNLRIAVAQGSCLGGSTVINDAVCFRIPELVVKQWQEMGVSISKDEWDRANDEVSKAIHVTEVTVDELNENAKKLMKACQEFRVEGKPILHYRNHRNCGPSFTDSSLSSCVKCGFCHLGCHYDTKQSMLVTYIHDSLADPSTDYTAYCNCRADRITYEGGVATGVDGTFVDAAGNEKFRIRVNAKVVIVSAGAIASSNLLQKSRIGGKNVGKGLALHPAPFVMGVFDDKIHGNRGIPMSYTCHEFGVTNGVEKGGFLIESIFLPVFQMALAIPSMGLDHRKMMENYAYFAMAGIMTRDEPSGSVLMSYSGNPKIVYNLSPQTIDDMARGMGILARMWFSVGAKSLITSHRDMPEIRTKADIPALKDAVRDNPDGLMLGSAHPQGGNRMGNDAKSCVVDSDCKVYGFDNLYVCDASVFPTPLGVNPQLTVMALATITADRILVAAAAKNKWNASGSGSSLGNTCDVLQPRFCGAERIGEMFAITDHRKELFPLLANSAEEKLTVGHNWKFDPKTLKIQNNLFWKGFYGRDSDVMTMALRYFGGFYKRFRRSSGSSGAMDGITHPFEPQVVDAKSVAREKEIPGYGSVIHLEYVDAPYSTAYDLLKMVDENTIIGKAFLGSFGRGRELFNFSMSRVYDVDFMTEQDLMTLFDSDELSHVPTGRELAGTWEGMLVSDSAISPRSQLFYFNYEDGEVDMRYSFANMLRGRSDVAALTDTLFRFDDPTPFHDELRMVTPDVAVGRWVTEWSSEEGAIKPIIDDFRRYLPIPSASSATDYLLDMLSMRNIRGIRLPREFGVSFLGVEEDANKGTRVGLSYLIKRIG
ncbi:MAG TPA: GMC family oxidoreductase [Nitrososphaera sp.]|nr:GMC family oxidoreductase [Nitrososphaera sp.]